MDVTQQVINEVEFHQKMRGYDPDEVDDFLERVAVAVGQMQERLQQAGDRVAAAERQAVELESHARDTRAQPASAPSGEEEAETMRRTLVLAQRTADAAIKEAEETAARTVQGAQEHARTLVAEAEADARKTADGTRARVVAEIITLEEARDGLRADHGILERHLEEQRLRLRSSIGELQRLLDDPSRLRLASAPQLSGATRPDFLDDELGGEQPGEAAGQVAGQDAASSPLIDLGTGAAPAQRVPSASGREPSGSRDAPTARPEVSKPTTGGVTFTPPEDRGTAPSSASASVAVTDREEAAWARFIESDSIGTDTASIDLNDVGDDAYLTELRKAMLEDTSPAAGGSLDDEDEASNRPRPRFGRRR